jgi:hypothetical protein
MRGMTQIQSTTVAVLGTVLIAIAAHAQPLPYPKQPGQQCAGSYPGTAS